MMKKYIMIENNSGYVWGEMEAETAEKACQALHTRIGGHGPDYEERPRPEFSNETGYHVYDGRNFDIDAVGGGDGQNKQLIEAVSALPKVGYFRPVREY